MSALLLDTVLATGQTLQLVEGDITSEVTDAIVNAANSDLVHGAGIAGAILHRGGPAIRRESDAWIQNRGPISHSDPAWTSGGDLACRFVIHAVGPVWGEGQEDVKLSAAVTGALNMAERLKLKSIAIPAISTGIFGFPKDRAAGVIFSSIREYFANNASRLALVRIVVYDIQTVDAFERIWHDHFSA